MRGWSGRWFSVGFFLCLVLVFLDLFVDRDVGVLKVYVIFLFFFCNIEVWGGRNKVFLFFKWEVGGVERC